MTWSLVQNAKKSVKKILELIRELTKVKVKLICINKLYHYILKINIWKLKFERQYHLQQHQKYKNRAKLKKMQSTQNNMGLNCVDPPVTGFLATVKTTAMCAPRLIESRLWNPRPRGAAINHLWILDGKAAQCPHPCVVQGSLYSLWGHDSETLLSESCFHIPHLPPREIRTSSDSPSLGKTFPPKTNSCQTPPS